VQFGSGTYLAFIGTVFFAYWAGSGSRLVRLAVILLANLLFCAHYGLFYVVLVPSCSVLDFLVGLCLMRLRGRFVRSLLMGLGVTLRRSREITVLCSPKVTHHHLKEVALLPLGKAAFARRQIT
jgi:hypothetical protein